MFVYCEDCRRYINERKPHRCKVKRTKKKAVVWSWRRPWHVTTEADRKIARKFAKCKTGKMF